jgi:hypothetical protein
MRVVTCRAGGNHAGNETTGDNRGVHRLYPVHQPIRTDRPMTTRTTTSDISNETAGTQPAGSSVPVWQRDATLMMVVAPAEATWRTAGHSRFSGLKAAHPGAVRAQSRTSERFDLTAVTGAELTALEVPEVRVHEHIAF